MSIVIIAFVIGAVAVIGIAIVSYMSSLVKNAYEIKIEMRKDLDDGLKLAQSEMVKASKSIRAELSNEAERTRNNLLEDLKRRFEETQSSLTAELKKRDEAWEEERDQLLDTISKLTEQLDGMSHTPSARIWNKTKTAETNTSAPASPAPETATATAATTSKAAQAPEPKAADKAEALPLASFDAEPGLKVHAK